MTPFPPQQRPVRKASAAARRNCCGWSAAQPRSNESSHDRHVATFDAHFASCLDCAGSVSVP
jgi:hypothetical protein